MSSGNTIDDIRMKTANSQKDKKIFFVHFHKEKNKIRVFRYKVINKIFSSKKNFTVAHKEKFQNIYLFPEDNKFRQINLKVNLLQIKLSNSMSGNIRTLKIILNLL